MGDIVFLIRYDIDRYWVNIDGIDISIDTVY